MATPGRDMADILRSTELLRVARADTIDALAASARIRLLRRDDILFLEGDRPTTVCAVAIGTLRVFTTSLAGTEPTFTLLSPGALVGELGVLDDLPRSASVAALRTAEVVEVPARAFRAAYDADSAIPRRLVQLLAERLRALSDGLADLTYLDLGGRLAKYLAGEADRLDATTFRLALTQAELGQMLGGARQTVNQTLQSLTAAGLVSVDGRNVQIHDLAGLRHRAVTGTPRNS
ncbi:MAG: Crp/Fnr family transcriptional regulator [Actinomycetota bacterium]